MWHSIPFSYTFIINIYNKYLYKNIFWGLSMTRNTKQISLIQIRSGELNQLPNALHQSEFGLATDASRLFIGNPLSTALANRNEFPYQNLEILTEYSDLRTYFKYSYENNIHSVDGVSDRGSYIELLPIVINCEKSPLITADTTVNINNSTITFEKNDDLNNIIEKINEHSEISKVYATQLTGTQTLTLIGLSNSLIVETIVGNFANDVGLPSVLPTADIQMPLRNVTNKLDDFLNITDFGIKGDGTSVVSSKIFNALCEVYKNNNDTQFFRNILFPAGTYVLRPEINGSSEITYPFPLISNLSIRGEGIDRTIIHSDMYNAIYPLLNGVDDKLNINSSLNYGNGSYPNNILIEDMTFENITSDVCNISSCSNIVFNRVKFVGGSTNTIIRILGKETSLTSNITFKDCIFEGGLIGIEISEYAKNITITNCIFKDTLSNAVLIGGGNGLASCCSLLGNTFINCASTPSATEVIKLGNNSKYVSIYQSQFDENIIEQVDSKKPYTNEGTYNFCDTLDINESTNKHLRFVFNQPKWDYVQTLYTEDGLAIVSGNDESYLTITNDGNLNLISNVDGDLIIKQPSDSNLILGQSKDETEESGQIIAMKDINLNGKKITNANNDSNISLEVSGDNVIEVQQVEGTKAYEKLIDDKDNAIPNVAYVKTQSLHSIVKKITSKDLANYINGKMPLFSFNVEDYGNDIHLTRLSLNVRKPFYKTYGNKEFAVEYQVGYKYYNGDVVKASVDGTYVYGVVTNTHTVETPIEGKAIMIPNTNVQLLEGDGYKDVKYIDVLGINSDGNYSFTKKIFYDISDIEENEKFVNTADIQTPNRHGLNLYTPFVNGNSYGEKTEGVSYAGKNYVIIERDDATSIIYTPEMLHNSEEVNVKYESGFNYIYDLESDLYNYSNNEMSNIVDFNWAGRELYISFADEDMNVIDTFDNPSQLNPSGELIVKIDFIRNTF